MLLAYPCHTQFFSDVLQATLEILARPHEVLDVVNAREPDAEKLEELRFGRR